MGNLYDMFWSFIALSYHLHDIAFENSAIGKKGVAVFTPFLPGRSPQVPSCWKNKTPPSNFIAPV